MPVMTVILRKLDKQGQPVDLLMNDDRSLSRADQQQWAAAMNRYLVSQGSQLHAVYLVKA
jgi:hypothetical protein